jgi:hypothetical protein
MSYFIDPKGPNEYDPTKGYPFHDSVYARCMLDVQHRSRSQLFDGALFELDLQRLAHIDLSGMDAKELATQATFEARLVGGFPVPNVVAVFATSAPLPTLVRTVNIFTGGYPALAAYRAKGRPTILCECQFPTYVIDPGIQRGLLRARGVSIP